MASKKFTQFDTANNISETEISVGVKGTDNFKRANYLTATTNPTASNDGTQGYTVGSLWFNVTDSLLYICKSSATGAAVWRRVTPIDGEWTPSISATNSANVTVNSAFYEYAGGGLCHFSMAFEVDMDLAQNSTDITISDLPIPTTFTNSRQVIAAINIGSNIAQFVSCVASSSGANILLSVNSASNGDSLQGLTVVGHYLVL